MNFKDQYKHPKWQKKRLEKMNSVMELHGEDELFCQWCGDVDDQFHIHHIRYYKDRKVWEYDDDELLLLCSACHESAHKMNDELKDLLFYFTSSDEMFGSLIHILKCMRSLDFHKVLYVPEIFDTLLKMEGKYKTLKKIQNGEEIH